jgi:hypothetical protein
MGYEGVWIFGKSIEIGTKNQNKFGKKLQRILEAIYNSISHYDQSSQ